MADPTDATSWLPAWASDLANALVLGSAALAAVVWLRVRAVRKRRVLSELDRATAWVIRVVGIFERGDLGLVGPGPRLDTSATAFDELVPVDEALESIATAINAAASDRQSQRMTLTRDGAKAVIRRAVDDYVRRVNELPRWWEVWDLGFRRSVRESLRPLGPVIDFLHDAQAREGS